MVGSLIPVTPVFFYYKITFVNSKYENTNSKGDFVLTQKPVWSIHLKIFGIQNLIKKYPFLNKIFVTVYVPEGNLVVVSVERDDILLIHPPPSL